MINFLDFQKNVENLKKLQKLLAQEDPPFEEVLENSEVINEVKDNKPEVIK